jgi:hypothetical protein
MRPLTFMRSARWPHVPTTRNWMCKQALYGRLPVMDYEPVRILGSPVFNNGIGSTRQPFRIGMKRGQSCRGKVFHTIGWRISKRFKQSRANHDWHIVRSKAEKPRGFLHIQSGWIRFHVQEFLSFVVHLFIFPLSEPGTVVLTVQPALNGFMQNNTDELLKNVTAVIGI